MHPELVYRFQDELYESKTGVENPPLLKGFSYQALEFEILSQPEIL